MEDKSFIDKLSKGDKETFDSFLDKYSTVLLKTISYVLNKPEDKDYIQECFDDVVMKIINKCSNFKFDCSFKVWIITIAKNTSLDYKRKLQKMYEQTEINESLCSDSDIEDNYINQEMNGEINKIINKLSKANKELFIKKYILELSTNELCDFYCISEDALYKRISRMKINFKKLWLNKDNSEVNFYEK